jgi:hypothetical protein
MLLISLNLTTYTSHDHYGKETLAVRASNSLLNPF